MCLMFAEIDVSEQLQEWRVKHDNQAFLHSEIFDVLSQRKNGIKCCQATIKIHINGQIDEVYEASEGVGPVDALSGALKKALSKSFPEVANWHLTDYEVSVVDSTKGAASEIMVFITATDGLNYWRTKAVSTDITEASWLALLDSFEYLILKHTGKIT